MKMKFGRILLAAAFLSPSLAQANTVDLTTRGSSGVINGAWYVQTDPQPTGTGVIQPFVRIQGIGVEEGYNTDYRPVQYDTKDQNQWTHSLLVANVPIVTYRGGLYRQFLLDINEGGNANLAQLSLDKVQLFLSDNGAVHDYPIGLGTMIYDMDTGVDSVVELNYRLNSGSGSGDMYLYVPVANFALAGALPYVTLYSHFGTPHTSDAGFEEWSTLKQTSPPAPGPDVTPLPSTAWAGAGLFGLLAARSFRRRRLDQSLS